MLQLYSYVQAGEYIMGIPPATHQSPYVLSLFSIGSSCLRIISMLLYFLHRSTRHCCYHTHHQQSQHRKTVYNVGLVSAVRTSFTPWKEKESGISVFLNNAWYKRFFWGHNVPGSTFKTVAFHPHAVEEQMSISNTSGNTWNSSRHIFLSKVQWRINPTLLKVSLP